MKQTRIIFALFAITSVLCLGIFLYFGERSNVVESIDPRPESTDGQPSGNDKLNTNDDQQVVALTEQLKELETTTRADSSSVESDSVLDSVEQLNRHPHESSVELTEFRGEMKRVKLGNKPEVDLTTHPSLPWFTKDATQVSFPDTTEVSTRDYFFGWVQLNPNKLNDVSQGSFASLGIEIFDGMGEYRRVTLPRSEKSLKKFLEHESVLAIGRMPLSEKVGPNFWQEIKSSPKGDTINVFVTLMTTENLPRWQSEMKSVGAIVHHWDEEIRVLVVALPYGSVLDLASRDFVQAIEPVEKNEPTLDSATAVAGADSLRVHGLGGEFSGLAGKGMTIGVIDSGLNVSHPDIYSNRLSICGENFNTNSTGHADDDDLWVDSAGHGSHVTGIFAGAGVEDPNKAGVAPMVEHIRFAKVLDRAGQGYTSSTLRAIDYLTEQSSCEWNSNQTLAKQPQVVNLSLGGTTLDQGYRPTAKKLDWAVWSYRQTYVVAAGNESSNGYTQYASSKNSLSVGRLTDANFYYVSSSLGPTSDGRILPNVSITGTSVSSVVGGGASSGYRTQGGTSMSSPAVAGVAALLTGIDNAFEDNPALVRAQLMATSIKPEAFLTNERWYPRNNTNGPGFFVNRYGLGIVSARTALTQGADDAWRSQSAISSVEDDESAYIEIDVPQNTARIDIVLTWDEPPNDNVGPPVVADLDLYFGPNSNCDVTECGEFASTSRIDNVEYLIISDPEPGRKRITIVPKNLFQHRPSVAVAWMYIKESTTPTLTLELTSDTLDAENSRRPTLDLTVSSEGFSTSGASLYIGCRNIEPDVCDYWYDSENSRWQPGSTVHREDGTIQDLAGLRIRPALYLGEIGPSERQEVSLVFPPTIRTGSHQLYLSVASANGKSSVQSVNVLVDDDDFPILTQQPPNDERSDAIDLIGNSGTLKIDLLAASREPSEVVIDNVVLRSYHLLNDWSVFTWLDGIHGVRHIRSVWYRIPQSTKPAKYSVQVTTVSPGNANLAFQVLNAEDPFTIENFWGSRRGEFFVDANQEYFLRVSSYWSTEVPSAEITWQKLDARPANDDFVNSTSIEASSGDLKGDITYATIEQHEPSGHIAVGSTWYTWTAPQDGVWAFEANYDDSTEIPTVLAYQGSSLQELRIVSDTSFYSAIFPVSAGEEYHISVSSDSYNVYQGSYELSWFSTFDFYLTDNDQFENSIALSGPEGSTNKCSRCQTERRTIETDEPEATTTHSLWWNWTATEQGNHTFRLQNVRYDTLSIFSGEDLDELDLVGTGGEVFVDADSGETFHIALHRVSGLDFEFDHSNNVLEWGPTPEYDRITNPVMFNGTEGATTLSLKYATSTSDETPSNSIQSAGVFSSVWGTWSTPPSFEGWMRFLVESWETSDLLDKTDQYFLGIHEKNDQSNTWKLVSSTDRSFIIGGRPEAYFLPEADKDYLVQIALRSNGSTLSKSQAEVDVSWEESNAPAWLVNNLEVREFGSPEGNNLEELVNPTAGLIVGENLDQLLLHVEDEMLALGLTDDLEDLGLLETIPYADHLGNYSNPTEEISVSIWSPARQVVYAPFTRGIGTFEGFEQSVRSYTECVVEDEFSLTPTHTIVDATERHLYKIGADTIVVYQIDGPCELSLVQILTSATLPRHSKREFVVELTGLQHGVLNGNGTHFYGFSDNNFLVFSRSEASGELTIESSTRHSNWLEDTEVYRFTSRFNGAQVVLDSSKNYLFAVGRHNPAVAVFDIASDPEEPKVLAAIGDYYLSTTDLFPSHIRIPSRWNYGNCSVFEIHKTDNPTIDVFCTLMYFVATWDTESEKLYLSDWSSNDQPDRFGNELPTLIDLPETFSVSTMNNQFTYLVVEDWIDAIHRFERVDGLIEVQPEKISPYDSYILRLVAMDVEPNTIIIGSRTITECEVISNLEIDGVTYTVSSSKWQSRSELGFEWEDVEGTDRDDNQLCPHDPSDNLEYRLVFEATIDGTERKYSSDVMVKPAE